ncbi:MAG: TolC family protein, partial [Bacteroidales bacterium]|nr:TolC family protein [Bacteroidales bacterium]
MTRKILFVFLIFLQTAVIINGQETMSLNDCMLYAIKNAPKAKIRWAENDNLQADYRDAALKFAPDIYGVVNGTANFGRSIDPETNTYANYQNFSNNYSL